MYYQNVFCTTGKKKFEDTVGIMSLVCSVLAQLPSSDRPFKKKDALKEGVGDVGLLCLAGFFVVFGFYAFNSEGQARGGVNRQLSHEVTTQLRR